MARNYAVVVGILAWIALIGIVLVAWGVVPEVVQPAERLSFPSGFPEVLRGGSWLLELADVLAKQSAMPLMPATSLPIILQSWP